MIAYFADRTMNILGQATTDLPEGLRVVDDLRTEDVEAGVATFEGYLPYNSKTRKTAELCCDVGNYIYLLKNGKTHFFTIINSEADTKRQEVYFYAEDAGLDLLNEQCDAFEADEAYSLAWYVEKFAFDSGFEIGINEAEGLTRKLSWDGKATATERLASVATQFGNFEISFSFEIEQLTVTRKIINIHKQRGEDNGVTLRLDREITRILTTKSIEELATGLFVEGGTPEGSDFPILLKNNGYDDGDFFIDGNYLFSREAAAKWSRYVWNKEPGQIGQYGHIVKYFSYDTTDQSILLAHAITELKKVREIEVNYEVDIAYLPENVSVGDRINIVDEAGKLYLSTRILKLEESESKQQFTATLGEHLIKKSGISSTVEALASEFARQSISVKRAETLASNSQKIADDAKKTAEDAEKSAEIAQGAAKVATDAAELATQAAGNATKKADAAEKAVENVQETITTINQTVVEAKNAADNAYEAAETAQKKAKEAEGSAQNAIDDADKAQKAAENAGSAAAIAAKKAENAKTKAANAHAAADAAKKTAEDAKNDAFQAELDFATLEGKLETMSNGMSADYARKTELTETTANLQSKIAQSAAGLSSSVSMLFSVDETKNNAQAQLLEAQKALEDANKEKEAAEAAKQIAQDNADTARAAAEAAQLEADNAKTAAVIAQTVADDAEAGLAAAEENLFAVLERAESTNEDIAAAEQAVETARQAATSARIAADAAALVAKGAQEQAATAITEAYAAQAEAATAAEAAALAQRLAEAAADNAETAQKKADAAAATAGEAQRKAEAAVVAAEDAQSVADAAVLAAKTAQDDADAAKARADRAAENLYNAQQDLASIEADVNATQEELEAAQAAVNAAQTATTEAQTAYKNAQKAANDAKEAAQEAQAKADIAHNEAMAAKIAYEGALKATEDARAAVELLSVRTKKCETDIEQTAEAVKIRATKDEVIETLGGYYTRKQTDAAIETRADEITLSVEAVKETADGNTENIERAHSRLKLLEDSFLSIVEDENGATILKQTSTGWTYDFSAMQDLLADSAQKLKESGEYIRFKIYEGEPCIELGEGDSDFKVLITNTRIMFQEGGQTPCFIGNNEFVAENVSIKEELRFGQWAWSVRANGNLGLSWKGATG